MLSRTEADNILHPCISSNSIRIRDKKEETYQGFCGAYATFPETTTSPSVLLISPIIADNKLDCKQPSATAHNSRSRKIPTLPDPTLPKTPNNCPFFRLMLTPSRVGTPLSLSQQNSPSLIFITSSPTFKFGFSETIRASLCSSSDWKKLFSRLMETMASTMLDVTCAN